MADLMWEAWRSAMWEVYRELGFDTDGDDHYHGPDDALMRLVVDAAKEFRRDYDEALHDLPLAVAICRENGYRILKTQPAKPGWRAENFDVLEELGV